MSVSLTHKFQSAKSNGLDNTLIQPSNWNDQHSLTCSAGVVLGQVSAAAGGTTPGAVSEMPLSFDEAGNATLTSAVANLAVPGTVTASILALAADPTTNLQGATKQYVDNTAFAMAAGQLPGQPGNAGKFLITNGTNASWAAANGTNMGEVSVTATTTLSSGNQTVNVAMASAGQTVTLPAATGLLDGPNFIIANTGYQTFSILDNTGVLIQGVPPQCKLMLVLFDNTTAAGTWIIGNISLYGTQAAAGTVGSGTVISSTAHQTYMDICQVSSTEFVVAYTNGTNIYLVVVTLSGTTVTAGSTATLNIAGYANGVQHISVSALSTQGVVSYYSNDSSSYYMVVSSFTISGTTITPGAYYLLVNSSNDGTSTVCMLTTTLALLYLGSGGGGPTTPSVMTLNLDGAYSPNYNTPVSTNVPYSQAYVTMIALSSSLALFVSPTSIFTISISGTVPTVNTPVSGPFPNAIPISVATLVAGSTYLMAGLYNNNIYACVITVSGTTVTLGTVMNATPNQSSAAPVTTGSKLSLAAISSTAALLLYEGPNSSQYIARIVVSGTTPSLDIQYDVGAAQNSLTGLIPTLVLNTVQGLSNQNSVNTFFPITMVK